MAKKQQNHHLSYNQKNMHKMHRVSRIPYVIMSMLIVITGISAVITVKKIREINQPLDSDYVSSELAKADFLQAEAPKKVVENTKKADPKGEQAKPTVNKPRTVPAPAKSTQTAITGNTNTSVAPQLPANVATPTSPTDTVRLFVDSIQKGDLQTANKLIGPALALDIASIAGSSDQSLALQECFNNYLCKTLLQSFNPPTASKVVITNSAAGVPSVAQVSFKLSQSSPILAATLGDKNLDVFLVPYQNVWVIQNLYINGQSLRNAGI